MNELNIVFKLIRQIDIQLKMNANVPPPQIVMFTDSCAAPKWPKHNVSGTLLISSFFSNLKHTKVTV